MGLKKQRNWPPDEQLQFQFSNPVAYKSLAGHIHFEPAVVLPDYYADWDQTAESLWLNLPLQPETSYSGWLDADLTDEFGNKLGQKTPFTLTTGSYEPSLNLTTGYGILEAYAQPRYPVSVLNADSVFLQAARVGRDELVPLLRNSKIFWSKEKYAGAAGFFSMEKEIKFKAPRNRRVVMPLELAPLLPEKYGWLFLQLDTGSAADEWDRYPKVLVQVTDLGISAKYSPENDLIWVTELKTGLPVADAAVEIRDDQNRGQVDRPHRRGRQGLCPRLARPGHNER